MVDPNDALEARLRFAERFRRTMNEIHAAADLDEIIRNSTDDLLALLGAERLTIFGLDHERREIFSRFLDPTTLEKVSEIRVPISDTSIAGYVAQSRSIVRLHDVRDDAELRRVSPRLRFDDTWDKRTGLQTRQVLAVPVLSPTRVLCGVLQLVNSVGKPNFDDGDESRAREVAESLGIALWNQRQRDVAVSASDTRRRFALLVERDKLTPTDLDRAIAEAKNEDREVELVLMEKYGVSKKDVGEALSVDYRCPFLDYESGVALDPAAVAGINFAYLKQHFWVPLRVEADEVEVWIDDPRSMPKLQDIRRVFPGRRILPVVGLRDDIYQAVHDLEHGVRTAPGRMGEILDALTSDDKPEAPAEVGVVDEDVDESSNAVIRLANQIIVDACDAGASDIHFEPRSAQEDALIRIRVDGVCRDLLEIPARYRQALTSRFKVMARLDIAERRRPQDGKIRVRIRDQDVELRVVTVPTTGVGNEDVVLRILAQSGALALPDLSMTGRNLREMENLLRKPHGIFLCVGPTGSGKTTTLHAALAQLNGGSSKIWTVEDPVEITQKGLRQVTVNPRIDLTFAAAMRTFLRADPDVIMVGEMRDRETAQTAIEASLTGHMVLSTLHTNSAAESVTRLLEMGIEPFSLADSLLGILAQRLVRTVCRECRESYEAPPEEIAALGRVCGEEAFAAWRAGRTDDPEGTGTLPCGGGPLPAVGGSGTAVTLYRARGCEACGESGYRGRVGIHELLIASDEVRRLVRTGAPAADVHTAAVREGMTTLLQDGVFKVLEGKTDLSQILAVVAP